VKKESKMPTRTIEQIIEGKRSQPGQLIEVLQDVQETFGYISTGNMRIIAQELGAPLIEVYRVASFYKAFHLKPSGKKVLTICMGTACHVRNAHLLLDLATNQLGVKTGEVTSDGLFSIERVNCLGACALGPIVKENQAVHHHMTPAKVRNLINNIRRQNTEGK
jgi:NADH:ubiquinone oxidoreductase subunit E